MSKVAKSPSSGAQKRKIPATESDKELRWRLRELDTVDVEFGDDFYNNSVDLIMARVERTEIKSSSSKSRSESKPQLIRVVPTNP